MTPYVDPATGAPLARSGDSLASTGGIAYPVVGGIPRFCDPENYTASFGKQWNLFERIQIDGEGSATRHSEQRFLAETGWCLDDLDGCDLLEVGSGAGRFSRVILEKTGANLYSVDYSSAVDANLRNNGAIAPDRFHLAQASIYDLPFADGQFDKVLCLGVLQHTPDFDQSIAALVAKARPGGEIVVDFYAVRGWWTWLNAKYLLRPFTKRMDHDRLLKLIERNAGRMISASRWLDRHRLGALRRFLPVVDIAGTLPAGLTAEEERQWVVLDTFDMFSPEHDHPQRIRDVAEMFDRHGADVAFAGEIELGDGTAAVVRAVRR
jgi:SAM-dependent methyltransferase